MFLLTKILLSTLLMVISILFSPMLADTLDADGGAVIVIIVGGKAPMITEFADCLTDESKKELTVLDENGLIVYATDFCDNTITINTANFEKGEYTLSLTSDYCASKKNMIIE